MPRTEDAHMLGVHGQTVTGSAEGEHAASIFLEIEVSSGVSGAFDGVVGKHFAINAFVNF